MFLHEKRNYESLSMHTIKPTDIIIGMLLFCESACKEWSRQLSIHFRMSVWMHTHFLLEVMAKNLIDCSPWGVNFKIVGSTGMPICDEAAEELDMHVEPVPSMEYILLRSKTSRFEKFGGEKCVSWHAIWSGGCCIIEAGVGVKCRWRLG